MNDIERSDGKWITELASNVGRTVESISEAVRGHDQPMTIVAIVAILGLIIALWLMAGVAKRAMKAFEATQTHDDSQSRSASSRSSRDRGSHTLRQRASQSARSPIPSSDAQP